MSRKILDFGRQSDSAARLYLQHWMIKDLTDSLLDPSVATDKEELRVADIACGTGIWLLDLAKSLPPTSRLDGFDISAAHFPPKHELPANVTLETLDSFAPVPDPLVGQYDIVHCRGFMLYVADGDPSLLLENIKTMLKPGGFLHWEELDVVNMYVQAYNAADAYPYCTKYINYGLAWLKARGIKASWVGELDKVLEQHGMQLVKNRRLSIKSHMVKPWTVMQVMATRDFIENDIIPTCGEDQEGLSPVEWREIMEHFPKECQSGARVLMDLVWVVGRKEGKV